MRINRYPLVFSLLIAASCAVANAASVVQSASIPSSTTTLMANFTVAKFDSSLGTLNSVKFDVSSLFEATLFSNATTQTKFAWAVEDPTITLSAPNGTVLINHPLGWIEFIGTSAGPAPSAQWIIIPAGTNYSNTKTLAGSASATTTANLSDYIGSGNLLLPFSADVPSFTLSLYGGNSSAGLRTTASGNVSVTYDYTPVPEPGSMLALAAGLLPLAGLAIRKRK